MKTIIIVGAGSGLGNHVARRFGSEGYRVILISRSKGSLENYKAQMEKDGIEAYIYVADASKPESMTLALSSIKERFGTPDVLFYNVGITTPDEAGKISYQDLMEHFQVDVACAYHCVQTVVNDDFKASKGAVFLTGGGLAEYPVSVFTPLSIDKAALKALAILLHDDLKKTGVYVGTLTVYGAIGGDRYMDPKLIADKVWEMNLRRDKCEIKYEYPELSSRSVNSGTSEDYWTKAYALREKYM